MRYLIVDDEASSRLLLTALIPKVVPGAEGVAVDTGEGAIDAFNAALDEGQRFDLVCLDIMMPDMSGQDVLRRLREREDQLDLTGLDGCKILMTTALEDPKNVLQAFRHQCDGYLVKPIRAIELKEQLKTLGLAT